MHFVRKVTLPGKYYDENGLILLVKETGAKSWVQRLTIRGRRRDMPVDAIEPADVMRCLLPIWNTKRETARKTRQRIGTVMKWAIAEGNRKDNPAGDAIGAALSKVGHKTTHQRAMAHGEVAAALSKVRNCNALASTKLAFELLVLTACRSREVREAKWDEVDLDARVWTVPGDRTKTGNEHRVPLSRRAISVLREANGFRESDLVFPTATGRTMGDNTLSKLLRDLRIAAVPHGFRSTFRDWCGEKTNAPREVAEAALATRWATWSSRRTRGPICSKSAGR